MADDPLNLETRQRVTNRRLLEKWAPRKAELAYCYDNHSMRYIQIRPVRKGYPLGSSYIMASGWFCLNHWQFVEYIEARGKTLQSAPVWFKRAKPKFTDKEIEEAIKCQ